MIETLEIKQKTGKFLTTVPVKFVRHEGRMYFGFAFNKKLMAEIKSMEGTKFHMYDDLEHRKEWVIKTFGHDKIWSAADIPRNNFQLDFLLGKNPFARYDAPLIEINGSRALMGHQTEGLRHIYTRRQAILAHDMGLGKSLDLIELMELSGHDDWIWVAPKGALKAAERELVKWKSKVKPLLLTYDGLVKLMNNWPEGKKAPFGVAFDECQKLKTPTAQRSQAGAALANGVRADWGDEGFVILMSGTPAPKTPADWWHLCEIACPGFIKEGNLNKFKQRLGVFEAQDSIAGGSFLQHITWLDDEKKCSKCGLYEEAAVHDEAIAAATGAASHPYQKSVNEVHGLYRRMQGLVHIRFKKDCLDLPEKIYDIIRCKPTPATQRAAKLIVSRAPSTIQGLTWLRELSDGFQYEDVVDGKIICTRCNGKKVVFDFVPKAEYGESVPFTDDDINLSHEEYQDKYFDHKELDCPRCEGTGEEDRIVRTTIEVDCPKVEVLKDWLDQHIDVGRFVCYGGFTGTVDRIVKIAQAEKWAVVRVDGRGWHVFDSEGEPVKCDALELFQERQMDFPKVVFIGQASSAGIGLTLTASPSIGYYSNDFNPESRMQSEDRIYRIGSKGANIWDVFHLPSDELVHTKLRQGKKLQDMSLGVLMAEIESIGERLF